MARYTKVVENRVKMLDMLVTSRRQKILDKLSVLKGQEEFPPRTLSVLHSPLVQGVIPGDILALYQDALSKTEIIDYDKNPNDFIKDMNRLLAYSPGGTGAAGTARKDDFVQVFREYGYTLVDNETPVFGRTGQFREICSYFRDYYLVLEADKYSRTADKASCNIMARNAAVLKKHGIPLSSNLFTKKVQDTDEDLRFKVFFKPTVLGGELAVKLPRGAEVDMYDKHRTGVDYTFLASNYNKAILNGCAVRTLAAYLDSDDPRLYQIDEADNNRRYEYNCVSFSFISNIEDFASQKNNRYFMEYIKFCLGQDAEGFEFCTEQDKVLGSELVIGSKLKELEKVAITGAGGSGFSGGMLVAGAGSGKTVLYNTLILQAVALNNNPYKYKGRSYQNNGNGAVVLLDNKLGEWVGRWRESFGAIGKKLYGFDGTRIQPDLLMYKINKGKEAGTVGHIDSAVEMYVAGTAFLTQLRYVIRHIYTQAGAASTTEFNNKNCSIDGITRIPRVLILIDEVTSMAANRTFRPAMTENLFIAKDTRTTNMAWLIGGQDISAQILPNSEHSNYPYRILGTLSGMNETGAKNRYAYYGATVPQEVKDYNEHHGRSILSQGVFLANNELTKSFYLPEDQNTEALQLIAQNYGTQGLDELDAIVQYGIRHGLFTYNKQSQLAKYDEMYPGNNILPAGLYQAGLISQAQYTQMTKECLGMPQQDQNKAEDALSAGETYQQSADNRQYRQTDTHRTQQVSTSGRQNTAQQESRRDSRQTGYQPQPEQYNIPPQKGGNIPVTAGEALYTGKSFSDRIPLENIDRNVQMYSIDASIGDMVNNETPLGSFLSSKSVHYVDTLYNNMWLRILKDASADTGGINRITIIEMLGDKLYVNKRLINIDAVTHTDPYGASDKVLFRDILNFDLTFRKCKGLRQLTLDAGSYRELAAQYGSNALSKAFTVSHSLSEIKLLSRNGQSSIINRETAMRILDKTESTGKQDRTRTDEPVRGNRRNLKQRMNTRVTSFSEDIRNMAGNIAGSQYTAGAYRRSYRNLKRRGLWNKTKSAFWAVTGTSLAVSGIAFTAARFTFRKIFNNLLD